MENEENKVSPKPRRTSKRKRKGLAAYFYALGKYKYWVVAFTVIGGIIGYIAIAQGVNKQIERLISNFDVEIPLIEEGGQKKYYDGSAFALSDFYSRNRLEKIKASDSTFGGLLVDKIAVESGVSIAEVKGQPYRYTLTLKRKYFSDDAVAKKFVKAIIDTELSYAENKLIDKFDYTFDENFESLPYLDQAHSLQTMGSRMTTFYDALTSSLNFLPTYSVNEDGLSLGNAKAKFATKHYKNNILDADRFSNVLSAAKYINVGDKTVEQLKTAFDLEFNSTVRGVKDSFTSTARYKNYIKTLDPVEDKEELKYYNSLLVEEENKRSVYAQYIEYLGYYLEGKSTLSFENIAEVDNLKLATVDEENRGVISYLSAPTSAKTTTYISESKEFGKTLADSKAGYVADETDLDSYTVYLFRNYKENLKYEFADITITKNGISSLIGLAGGIAAGFLVSSVAFGLYYRFSTPHKESEEE